MSSGLHVHVIWYVCKRKEAPNTYLVAPCRISPGGNYAPPLKDDYRRAWPVIDLRSSPDARPRLGSIPANAYHVMFDSYYSFAEIICADSTEKVVLQP